MQNFIIQVKENESGSRTPIQSWEWGEPPNGFAFCPEEFIPMFATSKGFVNIVVENGTVISMTENTEAKTTWEYSNPPAEPQPTPDEDRDAMLAALEYRTTMLEMGVN